MPLNLSAPGLRSLSEPSSTPFIGRISERADYPEAARSREVLRVRGRTEFIPPGFRAYLLEEEIEAPLPRDAYLLGPEHRYLADGDVIRLDPVRKSITALYRRSSPTNTFLVTERCDNYCLMCSQPPRKRDDSWLLDELEEVIPLVSPETREIGISGGEPGLLAGRLVHILSMMKRFLPRTSVHILSNGRSFADPGLAQALARIEHPDLMIGIPLYSDLAEEHDYVVQAQGAFDETIRGILNLKRARVRIELRFVIHAETYARLPEFARFVTRNLLFVDHVALMGLELMGFAKTNLASLWIDPVEYGSELTAAVRVLNHAGLNTSIYNHPLCVLPSALHPFARKSISDWKNVYFKECKGCARKDACGGFFASAALKRSQGITPFPPPD